MCEVGALCFSGSRYEWLHASVYSVGVRGHNVSEVVEAIGPQAVEAPYFGVCQFTWGESERVACDECVEEEWGGVS